MQLALPKLSQHETEATATHVAMLVKKQVATSTTVTIKCPYLGCPATLVVPKNLSARMQTLWCWHNSCPGKDGCGRPLEFVQSIPAAGTPTDGFFTIGHFTEVNYVETVPAPARTFSSEAECLHCQALAHGGGPKCKHTCMKRALTPDDSVQWPMHPFGTFVIKTDESSHPFNASIVSDSMRELLVDGVFWSHRPDSRPLKFYYHDSQQENFEAPDLRTGVLRGNLDATVWTFDKQGKCSRPQKLVEVTSMMQKCNIFPFDQEIKLLGNSSTVAREALELWLADPSL